MVEVGDRSVSGDVLAGSVGAVAGDGTLREPNKLAFDDPWIWLAAGWRDLWQAPAIGLTYGAIFALAALALALGLLSLEAHSLFPALAGGFLLLAPFFAMGLYETSRRMAAREPVTLGDRKSVV